MPNLSELVADRAPKRTFVLPKSAWADAFKERPSGEVAIGLRLLTEADIEQIQANAARDAVQLYKPNEYGQVDQIGRLEAYNDAVLVWIAGRVCCDPNDTDVSFFRREEDSVRRELTADGIRRVFDEYERFRAEESPTLPSATDDELVELAERIVRPTAFAQLTPSRVLRAKKLLFAVLDELKAAEPHDPDAEPDPKAEI